MVPLRLELLTVGLEPCHPAGQRIEVLKPGLDRRGGGAPANPTSRTSGSGCGRMPGQGIAEDPGIAARRRDEFSNAGSISARVPAAAKRQLCLLGERSDFGQVERQVLGPEGIHGVGHLGVVGQGNERDPGDGGHDHGMKPHADDEVGRRLDGHLVLGRVGAPEDGGPGAPLHRGEDPQRHRRVVLRPVRRHLEWEEDNERVVG